MRLDGTGQAGRRLQAWGLLVAAALAAAGIASGAARPAAARAAPPHSRAAGGFTVSLAPGKGTAGTLVRVEGRSRGGRPAHAWACWIRCGPGGLRQRVAVVWNGARFTLFLQAPAFVWRRDGRPAALPPGRYPLLLACLRGPIPGCAARPGTAARFSLTAGAPTVRWSSLPGGGPWLPAQPDSGFPGFGLGLGRVLSVGTCVGGRNSQAPELLVSRDLGRRWSGVPLPAHELGEGPGGVIGCRAVLPDPVSPATFYVAGAADPGTATPSFASPLPLYTTDGGRTWQLVPVPAGFTSFRGWVGFTSGDNAVVSWYSRAFFGQALQSDMFAEEVALQGGTSWVEVPLVCPRGAPCLWHIAGLNPAFNGGSHILGLVVSSDGGRSWFWARFAGMDLSGGHPVLSGSTVLWPAAVAWPSGTAGISGDGEAAPLLRSTDGGRHWAWVTLPAPPDGWATGGAPPLNTNLRVLPDGALLLQVWGGHPAAWLLRPRATAWCALRGSVPGQGLFLAAGRDLVWLAGGRLLSEPASDLRCAG